MREPIQPPRKGQRAYDYLKQIHPAIALWNNFSVSGAAKWDSGTASLHVGGGGGSTVVVMTPVGGIPARSADKLGKAVCALQRLVSDFASGDVLVSDAGQSVTVYNMAGGLVNGSRLVIAVVIDGVLTAIWEDCPPGASSTVPADPSTPFATAFSADFLVESTPSVSESDFSGDVDTGAFGLSNPTTGARIWRLSITGGTPSSGSAVIALPGPVATATLPYNCSAASAQSLFEVAGGAGNFLASGGPWPGTPIDIAAVGDYFKADFLTPSLSSSTLNGGATVSFGSVQSPSGPGNDTQCLRVVAPATTGSITIGYTLSLSVLITWDDTASSVQAKFDTKFGAGVAMVEGGPLPSASLRITWTGGSYAYTDVAQMTVLIQSFDFDGSYLLGTVANGMP